MQHIPVLTDEVIELLDPKSGETVLDVTVGLGGHAKLFLERIGKKGELIGLDADQNNLSESEKILDGKNVTLIHANFRDISNIDLPECDIIFADLGLSSPHVDDPSRGFSFREDGPLDLRFDQTKDMTAAELISQTSEQELAEIFKEYGELRQPHPLARKIKEVKPKTTTELNEVAQNVFGHHAKKTLPQIFQALRIAVNDELGSLKKLLDDGLALLKSNGRMGIISYHSLEDRMVKRRFRDISTSEKDPMTGASLSPANFSLLTKKAIKPTMDEIRKNPRSRSARFRVIKKL